MAAAACVRSHDCVMSFFSQANVVVVFVSEQRVELLMKRLNGRVQTSLSSRTRDQKLTPFHPTVVRTIKLWNICVVFLLLRSVDHSFSLQPGEDQKKSTRNIDQSERAPPH